MSPQYLKNCALTLIFDTVDYENGFISLPLDIENSDAHGLDGLWCISVEDVQMTPWLGLTHKQLHIIWIEHATLML